jgi:hypothetical protein
VIRKYVTADLPSNQSKVMELFRKAFGGMESHSKSMDTLLKRRSARLLIKKFSRFFHMVSKSLKEEKLLDVLI